MLECGKKYSFYAKSQKSNKYLSFVLFSQQQLQLLLQRLQLGLAVFGGRQRGLLLSPHQLLTGTISGCECEDVFC